jgi:hypothetical protein
MEEATEKIQRIEEHGRRLGDTVGRLGPEANRTKTEVQGVTVERDPYASLPSLHPLPI